MLLRRKQYLRLIRENLELRLPYAPSDKIVKLCLRDYFHYAFRFQADLEVDYFKSGIYRKSELVRMESLANNKRFVWRDSVQAPDCWKFFVDKTEFYSYFKEYLNRDFIICDNTTSYEDFKDFIISHQCNVFAKLPISCGGKDVFHWELTEDNIKDKYDYIIESGEKYIVEEAIVQTSELAEFAPSSVNTMRIVTIIDDSGNIHIANCLFRIGNGKDIDNFSSGGMVARVDIKSGIIMQSAIDGLGRNFLIHPLSGKQIIGFRIPHWNEYISFAAELAKKIKRMRYVGWDIVRKKDGTMCVIEGNKDAGLDIQEAPVCFGYEPVFNALLHDEKSFKHEMYGGCI